MNDGPPQYKKLYPNQELIVFDGGKDNKFEKALIPDNESPDCLNVEFNDGTVGTRQGAVKLNTSAAGVVPFDGLYSRRDNTGAETMLAFIGGSMKALNVTTFVTVASAQSVFTAGSRVGADFAENYIFIGNGGAGPYKYDGTYFTQHGVYAPTQTATVTSGTTGSLTTNGQYTYRYTYVNSALVESNLGPPTATFTVSSTALALVVANIASGATASMGISQRYLYRSLNGGSYQRVVKLADVSTTSYTDVIADANLGVVAPTDNGTPPKYNAIVFHQNLLFVNDVNAPNFVWYSSAGSPYTFASTNFFKVGDKTGDLVRGFASYDNYIVIFCELSTWINYMPNPADPTTWRQIKTNSPYGSKSPYGAVKCNVRGADLLLHPAMLNRQFVGFAALTGTTLDPNISLQPVTSAGSDLQSQPIEPDMFLVQNTYVSNISGIAFKNRAFLSVTYGAGATTNNRVYVWDFSLSNVKKDQKASWVPWEGDPYNISQFTTYGAALYGATSDSTGFVYKITDTNVYNDDGTAIDSYYESKEYSGFVEDTALSKDFRYLNVLIDLAGSYFMNISAKTDSDVGSGTKSQVSLDSGGTNWGPGMIWGVSNWGGGASQKEFRVFFGNAIRGKRLTFKFDNQNAVDQRFKVHRAQFLYNIRGYR